MPYKRSGKIINKKFREFLVPTVLTSMSITLSFVLSGMVVSNLLGENYIAAMNIVSPVLQAYTAIAILFGLGAASVMAIAKGRGDKHYANRTFTAALFSLVVLSALLTTAQYIYIDDICLFLSPDTTLFPIVYNYYKVLLWATPLILVLLAIAYCIRIDGKATLTSIVLITSNVLSLILTYVFIKWCGFGIDGAAFAMIVGYITGFFTLIPYYNSKTRGILIEPHFLIKIRTVAIYSGRIVLNGFPAALGSLLIMSKVYLINRMVIDFAGVGGVIIFTICISCWSFVSFFIAGVAQTMAPILGILYGESDYRGVKIVFRQAILFLLGSVLTSVALMFIFPQDILHLFGIENNENIVLGIRAIRLFSVSLIGTALSFLMLYYYMTIEKRKYATAISLVEGLFAIIPLVYVFGKLWNMDGVWIAFSAAEIITLLMIASFGYIYKRKSKESKFSILMLDNKGEESIYDVSLKATLKNAVNVSEDVMHSVIQHGINKDVAVKIAIAVEEIIVNIAEYNNAYKKNPDIDVRIRSMQDKEIISFRDNGEIFNPIEYAAEDNLDYKISELDSFTQEVSYSCNMPAISGASLIKSISEKTEYSPVLRFNQTVIVIAKK